MVNREKYHGRIQKLLKLTKLTPIELEKLELIDLRNDLEKKFPEVISEMEKSKRYCDWVEPGINTCFVDLLTFNNKKVGFVAIDVSYQPQFNQTCLNLGKVYILEEYRGNGIFPKYVKELLDLSKTTSYFMIGLSEPNRYTIHSLLKEGLLFECSNGLILGSLGLMFIIRTKTEIGDNVTLATITPYYDSNLFAPVQLIDGQLMVGSTCFIDEWDFNAKEIRDKYASSEKYMRQLGENIMEIGMIVDNFITEQIVKINSNYGKCE